MIDRTANSHDNSHRKDTEIVEQKQYTSIKCEEIQNRITFGKCHSIVVKWSVAQVEDTQSTFAQRNKVDEPVGGKHMKK